MGSEGFGQVLDLDDFFAESGETDIDVQRRFGQVGGTGLDFFKTLNSCFLFGAAGSGAPADPGKFAAIEILAFFLAAGLLAAGLGSAGADYFGGYAAYMLPSFIAKGSMAFIFGYFIRRYPTKNLLFFAFPAIVDMALIYYVAEVIMYGNIVSPLVNVPFSLLQGTIGVVITVILYRPLERFRLTPIQSE